MVRRAPFELDFDDPSHHKTPSEISSLDPSYAPFLCPVHAPFERRFWSVLVCFCRFRNVANAL